MIHMYIEEAALWRVLFNVPFQSQSQSYVFLSSWQEQIPIDPGEYVPQSGRTWHAVHLSTNLVPFTNF